MENWYRVRFLESTKRGDSQHFWYNYYTTLSEAEEKIKFFLKKNEDIFSRIGHVPDNYVTVDPNWDIVDHIPERN